MIGILKNIILYKKDKKFMQNNFIGRFIFKEYEDNRKDQIYRMGSYETGYEKFIWILLILLKLKIYC